MRTCLAILYQKLLVACLENRSRNLLVACLENRSRNLLVACLENRSRNLLVACLENRSRNLLKSDQKLGKNFKFIVENLSGVMAVVTAMYGDSRIKEGDFQTVEAETTNQKKTTKLLMLLTTKSDEAVISFMDALKSAEEDHIYEQIMDTVTTTHSDNHTDLISMDLKGALVYCFISDLCIFGNVILMY